MRLRELISTLLILALLCVPAHAHGDEEPPPAPGTEVVPSGTTEPVTPTEEPPPEERPPTVWSANGTFQILGESWNWFNPQNGLENDYSYLSMRLRGRLRVEGPKFYALAEVQEVQQLGLPTRAIGPAPIGQMGLGALYFAHALRPSINTAGVRQAYLRFGEADKSRLQIGRFDYASGVEVMTGDPILDWIKRERIKNRLIGIFEYTAYDRSFDGLRLDADSAEGHLTAFAARPTQGGTEPHFATEITKIFIGDLSYTFKSPNSPPDYEAQLFWVRYDDGRDVPMVDNRPPTLRGRVNTQGGLHINTLGFHYVTRLGAQGDFLAWYAHQMGKWGTQNQAADAFTVEAGYRIPDLPWRPWVRAGFAQFSGDGNPLDNTHSTFLSPLPTVRVFARLPYYTMSNARDVYAQLILSPSRQTTLRSELHFVSLATPQDLWYTGSGATQGQGINGYAGRPSGGSSGLGTLLDLSVEHRFDPDNLLVLYAGHVFGGGVQKNIYPGSPANWIFLDYSVRFGAPQ